MEILYRHLLSIDVELSSSCLWKSPKYAHKNSSMILVICPRPIRCFASLKSALVDPKPSASMTSSCSKRQTNGVSGNGTPKWMVYHGKPIYQLMIYGYPHFRKPPTVDSGCPHAEIQRLPSRVYAVPSENQTWQLKIPHSDVLQISNVTILWN